MKINDFDQHFIIVLTGSQLEIDRDNQIHLNVNGTEFLDNFSTGKEEILHWDTYCGDICHYSYKTGQFLI